MERSTAGEPFNVLCTRTLDSEISRKLRGHGTCRWISLCEGKIVYRVVLPITTDIEDLRRSRTWECASW